MIKEIKHNNHPSTLSQSIKELTELLVSKCIHLLAVIWLQICRQIGRPDIKQIPIAQDIHFGLYMPGLIVHVLHYNCWSNCNS